LSHEGQNEERSLEGVGETTRPKANESRSNRFKLKAKKGPTVAELQKKKRMQVTGIAYKVGLVLRKEGGKKKTCRILGREGRVGSLNRRNRGNGGSKTAQFQIKKTHVGEKELPDKKGNH